MLGRFIKSKTTPQVMSLISSHFKECYYSTKAPSLRGMFSPEIETGALSSLTAAMMKQIIFVFCYKSESMRRLQSDPRNAPNSICLIEKSKPSQKSGFRGSLPGTAAKDRQRGQRDIHTVGKYN
jgi:hypothetical protein